MKQALKKLIDGPEEKTETAEFEPPSIERLVDDVLAARSELYNFFRPSMLDGCDRANVFHYNLAPRHPQRQAPRMMRILDSGTAIHEIMQGYLADHHEWWFAPEARVLVEIDGALVRGSCDGVLIHRTTLNRGGVEFKSINHTDYVKLTKAKPGHVKQAIVYMRLQKLPWIVIVYWDKDKQHIKEYVVRASATDSKAVWKETRERIRYLKQYVDDRKLPQYDPTTCDTGFCMFVDHCRKKGAPV